LQPIPNILATDVENDALKLLMSIAVGLGGLGLAWVYWRKPRNLGDSRFEELLGDRPWRRLGAGICLVLAVMFVLGVWVVDIPDKPVPYAIYWIIMMGLTVWLCVLAVRDAFHTRRVYEKWRAERRQNGVKAADSAEGRSG
jgi:hypothetical protein